MIYGFISSLDDETTKVFFRSKKIRGNNIYNSHWGQALENWNKFYKKCLNNL